MITHELHLPTGVLASVVDQLTRNPEQTLAYRLGQSQIDERRQWLVRPTPQVTTAGNGPLLRVVAGQSPEQIRQRIAYQQGTDEAQDQPKVILGLGVNQAAGYLAGLCISAGEAAPLERVVMVGPGLVPSRSGNGSPILPTTSANLRELHDPFRSRTIGALGADTMRRIRGLSGTIVGCGRLGSLAVSGLVPLGIRRLFLVDSDVLEPHNLGEMAGVMPADVGRPKAEVLGEFAHRIALDGYPATEPIVASVLALESLYAVKRSDLLVSCPDNGAARLAAQLLATIYLKPLLLDIGTGIITREGRRRMGADIRLVLPGRCLACFGGITDLGPASAALLRGASPARGGGFPQERLGSLRSLNTVAWGLAQTLLEQFLAGRLTASTWLQLDVDDAGVPHLTQPTPPPPPHCPICALAAQGDAGLEALTPVLERLAA